MTQPIRVEPRILLESGNHAIQLRVRQSNGRYKTVRRKIGTLEQARAALAHFDATGQIPPPTAGHGKPIRPAARPTEPKPDTEQKERRQVDYVQTARNSLTSAKIQLEAQLRQIDVALAALTDEEDASAGFRFPGVLADRVDPEVRDNMNASAEPKRKAPSKMRDRNYYKSVRRAIVAALSTDVGKSNGQIREAIAEATGEKLDSQTVSNLLSGLRQQGAVRRDTPGNNRNTTIWYRTEPSSEPAPAASVPTPES